VEYRDIHLLAATIIAEGLVDLGILQGNAEDLVEMMPTRCFFPHGVGICWDWMSTIWKIWETAVCKRDAVEVIA